MSLRELVAMALGIRIILGEVVAMISITLLMIYSVNAYPLHKNNIMITI